MLEIKDLCVVHKESTILNHVNLTIKSSEKHIIMGPNGAGKTTLVKVLSGDPDYEITSGSITFEGKNLAKTSPEERVHQGLFVGFQSPPEIPGVPNSLFLKEAANLVLKARNLTPLSEENFNYLLTLYMSELGLSKEFAERNLNQHFSGGEKKRNEILQLLFLNPVLSILDEIDSGLDVDAIQHVCSCLEKYYFSEKTSLLLITHYSKLADYIQPDYVHIFSRGTIVTTGGLELVRQLEAEGYQNICERESKVCR